MKTKQINKWTTFWDMHSGGECKEEPYEKIYIEAPEEEARVIFYNRFGHNPDRVSCTCCGEDYTVNEDESLEQATGHHRGCRFAYFKNGKEIPEEEGWTSGKGNNKGVWSGYIEEQDEFGEYQTLDKYLKNSEVLVIYSKDIKPEERKGEIPEQGYVWVD